MPTLPKCPVCNTNKGVQRIGTVGDMYGCNRCHGQFDVGEDGGDFFADPSRRLERQDEREAAHRNRLGGRRR